MNFFASISFILCFGLWLLGGAVFDMGWAKLELGDFAPWFLLFLGFAWADKKYGRKTPWYQKTVDHCVKKWSTDPRNTIILLSFVIGALFLAHCFRHWSFGTHAFDLIFLHQPLAWPWGSPALKCDFCPTGTYLAEHQAFTLFLLAPLTSVLKSNVFIFFLQALIVGLTIWFGTRLGPLAQKKEWWLGATFLILCHSALRNSLIWDFREDLLVFAFLTLSCVALWNKKITLYIFALALAAASKENAAFAILFLSFPIILDKKHLPFTRKQRGFLAAGTAIGAIAWIGWEFAYLIPKVTQHNTGGHNIGARLPLFGDNPKEILFNILFSPRHWWLALSQFVFTFSALKYLVLLLGPYLYFGRRALPWMLPALPGIGMNLLGIPSQRSLSFHYDLIILPFLMMSLWVGMRELKATEVKKLKVALALALLFSGRWPGFFLWKSIPTIADLKKTAYLSQIMTDEILAAGLREIPHLAHLPNLRGLGQPSAPPPSQQPLVWQGFWAGSKARSTAFASARDATLILLDTTNDWHRRLLPELKGRGWRPTSRHASLILLRR